MAATIEEIKVVLDAATAEFDRKMAAVQTKMQQVGTRLQSTGRALTTGITAPLAVMGGAAVKAFADFDQAMTESLSIMSDVTEAQERDMVAAAKTVARETTLSAEQAAESYFFLASAGLDAEESIAALPQVARLAQAGAFDMATATDLATDSMSAMGMETEDLARVTDVMVKANEIANTSVEQFGKALTNQAGPALRNVGKSIEEGGAVLAVFADQGIKAEKAGVLLRQSIDALTQGYNANKQAFDELGIELFDAEGNMRNMADITADFENALGGMSDKAKSAAFQSLGLNVKVRAGISALMGNSEALRGYQRELENAGGATERVSEKQMQSFSNQLELAKQNVVLLGIEMGQKLAPIVQRVAQFIGNLASQFETASNEAQSIALGVASAVASFGPMLIVVGKIVAALGGMGAVITGLITGGGAIIAFAGAAGIIIDNWNAITEFFSGLWNRISELTTAAADTVAGLWRDHGDDVLETIAELIQNTVGIFEGLAAILTPIVRTVLGVLVGLWEQWGDNLLTVISNAWNLIVDVAVSAGEMLEGVFKIIGGVLNGNWSMIWEGIVAFARGAWNTIISVLQAGITAMLNALDAGFSWLPVIGPKINDAKDAISNFIDENLKADVKGDAEDIRDGVASAHESAQEAVESSGSGIRSAWEAMKNKSVEWFGASGTATKAVTTSGEKMSDAMRSVKQTFDDVRIDGLMPMSTALQNNRERWNETIATLQDFNFTGNVNKETMQGLKDAIDQGAISTQQMGATVQASSDALDNKKRRLEAAKAETERYNQKVERTADTIENQFNRSIDRSVDALVSGGNPFKTALSSIKQSMQDLVSQGISNVIKGLITGDRSLTGSISTAIGGIGSFIGRLTGGGGGGEGGGSITGALGSVVSGVTGLGGTMTSVMSAAGPFGIAAAAGFGIMKAFGLNLGDVWNGIKDGAKAVGNAIGSAFKAAGEAVKAVAKTLFAPYKFAFNQIMSLGKKITGAVGSFFKGAGRVVKNVAGTLLKPYKFAFNKIKGAAKAVTGAIGGFFKGLGGVIKGIAGGIKSAFSGAFNAVKGIARGAANAVGGIVSGIGSAVSGVAGAIGGLFGGGKEEGHGTTKPGTLAWYIDKLKGINDKEAVSLAKNAEKLVEYHSLQGWSKSRIRSRVFDYFKNASDEGVLGPEEINPIYSALGLAQGGLVMDTIGAFISENPATRPEAVLPIRKIPDVARSMGIRPDGGMTQEINVILNGRKIAQTVARNLPEILDVRNLR